MLGLLEHLVGLQVSISGGNNVMETLQSMSKEMHPTSHVKRNVEKLLSSVQDPFQLSASDALLNAAVICAEFRCQATHEALNRLSNHKYQNRTSSQTRQPHGLPSWLHLSVECGSISVAASISYHGEEDVKRPPVTLFRLACDSRTGCFIPIFPQSASLLRHLVCNDPNASEVQLLRQAKMSLSLEAKSSRATARRGMEMTGRIVRDAFDSMTRSMDILGRRVGVGGDWDTNDEKSAASLRDKSIMQACDDVRASMMTCVGIAAVFSVGAIAAAVASGTNPEPDM